MFCRTPDNNAMRCKGICCAWTFSTLAVIILIFSGQPRAKFLKESCSHHDDQYLICVNGNSHVGFGLTLSRYQGFWEANNCLMYDSM